MRHEILEKDEKKETRVILNFQPFAKTISVVSFCLVVLFVAYMDLSLWIGLLFSLGFLLIFLVKDRWIIDGEKEVFLSEWGLGKWTNRKIIPFSSVRAIEIKVCYKVTKSGIRKARKSKSFLCLATVKGELEMVAQRNYKKLFALAEKISDFSKIPFRQVRA